ncbi:MAG: hypothetical protein RSD88_08070 [Anaerovoracaceae bacterium]
MKSLTRLALVLSALTVVVGYVMVIVNLVSLRKSKKLEKTLMD